MTLPHRATLLNIVHPKQRLTLRISRKPGQIIFFFQSAHLLKKAAPEIVKTSAEGTPSKEGSMVNGHQDDASSVKSRDEEKSRDSVSQPTQPGENECGGENLFVSYN